MWFLHNMHSCTHAFHRKKKKQANSFFILYVQLRYHWSPYVYIETLCEAMVIEFRYIKTLFDGMVFDFLLFISTTFSDGMVIDLLIFISRPSVRQWSSTFGISRPFSMEWSSISFCLYQRPSSMKWSLISLCLYWDPLRSNGHQF